MRSFEWPFNGSVVRQFTGGAKDSSSPGIDILGAKDSPVIAAWDGRVTFAGDLNGYGKIALIEHCEGLIGVYANLAALTVQRGSQVQKGQILGSLLFNEGYGGAVLHFELRENKLPIDPMRHLKSANVSAVAPRIGLQ